MAETKKYYWLKLKRDFFKRHDIRIIEEMPNGKDYILFYLKLLLESIDHDGTLRFSDAIPYNEQMLSVVTNTNIDIVRSAMKIFTELNMMEVLDDGTFYMSEVNKMIGSESAWAEKKRKQRSLPKLNNGSTRVNAEMLRLPSGETRFVDEKRYGGNGMFVMDRAGGNCEICGSSDAVVIHHNNGYSNEPEDLICLCTKCHGIIHNAEYGGKCPPYVLQVSDKSKSIELEKDIEKDIELDVAVATGGNISNFELQKGTLGRGVVLLTPEQDEALLDKLGFDGYNHYISKLAAFIIDKGAKVSNHYATILKWAEQDSKT